MLTLTELQTEITNHDTYKVLDQAGWEAKIEVRDITRRSQKDFDVLIPMYVRKLDVIRQQLIGEWDFNITVSEDGKQLKSDAEILDAVKAKTDEWFALNAKEQRMLDKLAVCLKEVELREQGLVIRTDLHDQANYYIDFNSGNDGNTGLSTGQAWKTLNKYTTTTVRTPGDVAYVRANTTLLQGTEAVDITFDESGTVDDYISIIGCDSVINDPWSDSSDVLPIVDFEDAAYQIILSSNDFWYLERLDFRQSTDANGLCYISYATRIVSFKDCVFSDSSTNGIRARSSNILLDGCSFFDLNASTGQVYFVTYSNQLVCIDCTFDAGSGIGSSYAIRTDSGGEIFCDGCSFGETNQFSAVFLFNRVGQTVRLSNCSYDGTLSSISANGVALLSEDDDATFESHTATFLTGTISRQTSSPRTGGADSYAKMLPTSECGPSAPLRLGEVLSGFSRIWAAASVQITITVYARVGSAWDSALTASEAFLRASYLSNGASAARTEIDSAQTIANDTTWTVFTVTITPQRTGWVYLWFYLAEYEDATEYIDVDIKPIVS